MDRRDQDREGQVDPVFAVVVEGEVVVDCSLVVEEPESRVVDVKGRFEILDSAEVGVFGHILC